MKLLMKIKQNKTVRTIIQKKCITISTVILSRKGLEARVYNSGSEPVAWETITIRRYLNNEFLSSCFDAREQGKICDSEIRNTGKNNTIDKLFLLSLEEAESMFNSDEERKCAVSEQAKRKGAYSDESTGNVWWWLRTPGEKNARHSGTEPAPGVFLKWKESVPDSKKALHKLAQDAVLNQHSPGRQAQDAAVENSQPMLRKRLQEPELFGGEGYAVPRAQRAQ